MGNVNMEDVSCTTCEFDNTFNDVCIGCNKFNLWKKKEKKKDDEFAIDPETAKKINNDTQSVIRKPPLGLTPERFHEKELLNLETKRIMDIVAAIERYNSENYVVPHEWIEELSRRLNRLFEDIEVD